MNTDAIKARLEAATPGPWEVWADDDDVIGQVVCQMWPTQWKVMRSNAVEPFADSPDVYANAEFIAHSVTDLAALLEENDVLKHARLLALDNAIRLNARIVELERALIESPLPEGQK
jgi:hypothetical protein